MNAITAIKLHAFLLVLGFLVVTSGCRAHPAPDAGFLQQPKLMAPEKDLPFNRVYVSSAYRDKQYTEIWVAPVNTDYVMAQNLWEKATLAEVSRDNVNKNIQAMADYLREAFKKAARNDPKGKFKVVDTPGPNTLILETAIVQIVPSKSELQAISYVTWISSAVMVGSSLVTQSEDQGKGVIAIEARARDGATGEVVLMFADREHPPTAIVDIKSLFWWEPAKPICDGWAKQFIEMENGARGKQIDEISNFDLLVW